MLKTVQPKANGVPNYLAPSQDQLGPASMPAPVVAPNRLSLTHSLSLYIYRRKENDELDRMKPSSPEVPSRWGGGIGEAVV
jgi:hypothetical protein